MRICLVAHGFPPYEITGVENYTLALARALARAGHAVEVFAARAAPELPDRALRREPRDGWAVNWVISNARPRDPLEALDPPGIAEAFERFLERERPEVVHFQHVIKLGLGLIERARAARIPIVYTAHDYYPVCHRFTLLRPDLARCSTIGDPRACARCDLALSLLDRERGLGDYQMGALPGQLEAPARAALERLLAGDEHGAGVDAAELEQARARRAALDARRREAFALCDRVLAPTRFLRERLLEGGLDPARVSVVPYGIEDTDLRGLEPRSGTRGAPLRVGFLGGISKHKGVHVLLDAWELLGADPGAARSFALEIWGGSSDTAYVESQRRRAELAGVAWRGTYERYELPTVLAGLDLVVVPSIWVENQPLVIREALAAGRPVLASRVGALAESVREGRDGWLFEPGDAADLARVLRELGRSGGLAVRRMAAGLEPVKDLGEQVRELERLYAELAAARRGTPAEPLPEHLLAVARRHAELEALPTRELFALALGGLERLAGVLGVDRGGGARLLADALGPRSRAQEFIADGREERAWHRRVDEAHASGLRALSARVEWRESLLAARERELEWVREEAASLRREGDWLRETLAGIERERDWLRETLAGIERERDWLKIEVAGRDRALAWRSEQVAGLERELAAARAALEDCGRRSEPLAREVGALLAAEAPPPADLRRAAELLREELGQMRRVSEALAGALAPSGGDAPAAGSTGAPGGAP